MNAGNTTACKVLVRGVVQGVGFRPFVFRLAAAHQIRGWVLNGEAGVEIHAEGAEAALKRFVAELEDHPPPAAKVAGLEVHEVPAEGHADFQIVQSQRAAAPTVRISPDLAVCDQCLRELRDTADRRFHYPYVNCTNCGPRYSIIRALPYDRAQTTMAGWPLCDLCRREFEDPFDRRYHAQPTACAACGPRYRLIKRGAERAAGEDAIRQAATLLRGGQVLAVKGIGGYHLACDAGAGAVVETLRTRKFRKDKPFAVLVRDIAQARELLHLTPAHEQLLQDVARPIVVAPRKVELPGVAPDTSTLGVMLPYTPLHHLLFEFGAPSPLVLTSANRASEPIACQDDDALERLAGIADAFLVGQRPIARRVDDSLVTVRDGQPFVLRRSRGYSPGVVARLPFEEPLLAVGADLKNSIALVVQGEVVVSQHLGDLDEYLARVAFEETIRDLLAMYDVRPDQLTLAHDLHPQYHSTRWAAEFPARRHVAVQHHEAHLASVLAESLATEPELATATVVGAVLDGTGYGLDGSIWGCEFFVGSLRGGFAHPAGLRPAFLAGGDAAARFPVQSAAGFLAELDGCPDFQRSPFNFPERFTQACGLIRARLRSFPCTSAGRLFDTAAALVGFTHETSFEGQAAMWLENLASQAVRKGGAYPFPDLDYRPLLQAVVADRLAGRDVAEIAWAFHAGLARGIAAQVKALAAASGAQIAAFSGGVFQNQLLWELLMQALAGQSLRVLTNRSVPVNDGGICLGQAALAALGKTAASRDLVK